MPTRNLKRATRDVAKVPRTVTPRAGALVAEIAADEARRATGDGRMSGMGRRAPKLRAVVRNRGRGRASVAEVRGVPARAWAILESGARPHVIAPPRRGAAVLYGVTMRHPVSAPVRHPGARGKRAWTRVVRQARREVPDLYAEAVHEAVT